MRAVREREPLARRRLVTGLLIGWCAAFATPGCRRSTAVLDRPVFASTSRYPEDLREFRGDSAGVPRVVPLGIDEADTRYWQAPRIAVSRESVWVLLLDEKGEARLAQLTLDRAFQRVVPSPACIEIAASRRSEEVIGVCDEVVGTETGADRLMRWVPDRGWSGLGVGDVDAGAGLRWDSSGTRLAYTRTTGEVAYWSEHAGATVTHCDGRRVFWLRGDEDRFVYYQGADGAISRCDLATGEPRSVPSRLPRGQVAEVYEDPAGEDVVATIHGGGILASCFVLRGGLSGTLLRLSRSSMTCGPWVPGTTSVDPR